MTDRSADEPPEGVTSETDRDEREQNLPERLMRDGLQRTLLIRELAPCAERELQREDPDDRVDERTRDESRP